MELIGKLKEEVSKAQNKEEVKGIMEKAGMRLTDEELNMVAGGKSMHLGSSFGAHTRSEEFGDHYNALEVSEWKNHTGSKGNAQLQKQILQAQRDGSTVLT